LRIFAAENVLDASKIEQSPVSLTPYFAIFHDESATLSFSDIQTSEIANRFFSENKNAEAINFGYSKTPHWLRFTLHNSSDQPVERMLEISDARLSTVQFFQPDLQNNYSSQTTGAQLPFSTRVYKNHYFVFPITLPANSQQTYFLRIYSNVATIIPAKLWTVDEFKKHERSDYLIQSWYFGMVSAMVMFNVLLFILLRDRVYVLYAISSFSIALVTSGINGLFKEFIAPDSLFLTNKTPALLTAFSTIAFLFFMRDMLKTKVVVPNFDRVIQVLIGIFALLLVGYFTIPSLLPIKLLVIIYFGTPVVVLVICVLCILKRQRSAYLFFLAFAIFLTSAVVTQLRSTGFLPTNLLTIYCVQIGSVLEIQLMAVALADRFNSMRKEKENAQRELLQVQNRIVENLKESEAMLENRVAQRTKELEIANQKLAELSMTDGLTGIANRRHFDDVLAFEWERAHRQNQVISLGLLDVDWFKKYNDCYGHQMGDECLKQVAQILKENVARTGDLVARYGGEEFAFIAPATDGDSALRIARKICRAFEKLGLPHELSDFNFVSVSIGVAAIVPSENLQIKDLIQIADEALYSAKKEGRNQAIIADII
jgi:diguanylate cyclase (GGDEF)-like protein